MTHVNPVVVHVPDGRIGCLVARDVLHGYVEFDRQRRFECYPLAILVWHLTPLKSP